MKYRQKLIKAVLIALFSSIITICSWITIPAPVPFTLQTFAVFAALDILGGKSGILSVLLYIMLGTLGVPVFSGFRGGIGILLGSTGGYILGFILCGIIYALTVRLLGEKLYIKAVAAALGMLACYTFGTVWFMLVYTKNTGSIGIQNALIWCVLPFIIPDAAKIALALFISSKTKVNKLIE